MYFARRNLRISVQGQVREIEPGSPIDVSSWSEYVIRANIARGYIEKRDEEPQSEAPIVKPKRGRKKATEVAQESAS